MVTVPDDLHRHDTGVLGNLNQSIQGSLHLLVLLVDVLGSDLPVGF